MSSYGFVEAGITPKEVNGKNALNIHKTQKFQSKKIQGRNEWSLNP